MTRALRVLLVEDNPGDARLFREALRNSKTDEFELEWVPRFSKAQARLALGQVDVVVVDLLLPDSFGMDTMSRLRELAPNVPMVVLTGVDEDDMATQVIQEGAQDYLPKSLLEAQGIPYASEAITRCLRYSVERARIANDARASRDRLERVMQTELESWRTTSRRIRGLVSRTEASALNALDALNEGNAAVARVEIERVVASSRAVDRALGRDDQASAPRTRGRAASRSTASDESQV